MSLTLLLETSSHRYSAALVDARAPGDLLDYRETSRNEVDYDGVPGLAAAALAKVGVPFRELGAVAVDVGPGNLTSVRSGVAYANALSYSVGVPLLGPNSLELLALSVGGAAPVLALRKAGGSCVYGGVFAASSPPAYAVGELADVVKRLAGDLPDVVVAGAFRDRVARLIPDAAVGDSGIELPDARAIRSWLLARPRAPDVAPDSETDSGSGLGRMNRGPADLVPLTESSGLFHD